MERGLLLPILEAAPANGIISEQEGRPKNEFHIAQGQDCPLICINPNFPGVRMSSWANKKTLTSLPLPYCLPENEWTGLSGMRPALISKCSPVTVILPDLGHVIYSVCSLFFLEMAPLIVIHHSSLFCRQMEKLAI